MSQRNNLQSPLLSPTNSSSGGVIESKSPTNRSEQTSLASSAQPRLFSDKINFFLEGRSISSEEKQIVRKNVSELKLVLESIRTLPENIQEELDFSTLDKIDFDQILENLDDAIESEAKWRYLKGSCLAIGVFSAGALLIRGMVTGIFSLLQCLVPSGFKTGLEAATCGWEISKWPSIIFGGVVGVSSGIGFCCVKGDKETNLIALQEKIEQAANLLSQIQQVLEQSKRHESSTSSIHDASRSATSPSISIRK